MQKQYIDSLKDFCSIIKGKADDDADFLTKIICVSQDDCRCAIDFFRSTKVSGLARYRHKSVVFATALEEDKISYGAFKILFYLNDLHDNSYDRQSEEYMQSESSIEFTKRQMKDDPHIIDILQDEDIESLYRMYRDRLIHKLQSFIKESK